MNQALAIFNSLAEDGTVVIPMQPDSCAKTWAMVNGRFGTPSIVDRKMLDYL